ncbi:GNAT family N-acetyltransferase [Billgrantia tianxiuensis]|jgi:ribosomal protein S18 acetylase RimI-like enzyme|uniref:GNAT family N-acetyltransferase n=1 Tax=Billgrantia tianxiuensis TaxID=2497861 RepID=A0A6I6SP38_9GAMM|nr:MULTISPECIES: GNAT family N-acetyltransferase [Halomonas]MCE8032779.1 GNAT family N-acetyltransferase [Halomonas sp. MCCC 1A11057]QHC49327.1 GNAT family N-acetyltransferase [Halomonas tianxiuensis]
MVTIRPYCQADCEALRSLVLCLHETLRPFDADLAPGDEIIEGYFQELMAKVESTSGAVFVAEDGSELVGYVCLWGYVSPDDPDERPDPFSFMAELFVRPESRHLGVGRLLVEQAERYAAQCGTYKVELKVLARNEQAIRFYEALGYEPRVVVMSKHF